MSKKLHINSPEAFATTFSVSRETLSKLETYASLLRQWQKTINLVAPSTLDDIWHRHFADSAQLLEIAGSLALDGGGRGRAGRTSQAVAETSLPYPRPQGEKVTGAPPVRPLQWLDVGSGAGFPGMVLAIMLAETSGARVTLIESDQRKAAFLGEVSRRTAAPVEILSIRIESAPTRFNLPVPEVVTARALAPLSKLLQLVSPFFGPATVGLFLKGRDAEREIAEASRGWLFACESRESLTDDAARIVIVRDVAAKPEE